jgi:hypothetical protein
MNNNPYVCIFVLYCSAQSWTSSASPANTPVSAFKKDPKMKNAAAIIHNTQAAMRIPLVAPIDRAEAMIQIMDAMMYKSRAMVSANTPRPPVCGHKCQRKEKAESERLLDF